MNRLVSVETSTNEALATYTYDYLNRRVSATQGTHTTYFHYDGASANCIAETDEDGGFVTYAYGDVAAIWALPGDG